MTAHDGCFDDLSVVIVACPFVVCFMPHLEALKLVIYSSGQCVMWDQSAIVYSLFLNPKIAVMHWSNPKSYNKIMCL